MNTYHAFFKGRKIEVTAETSLKARDKAAAALKARKAYEVTVVLVGRADGSTVTHTAVD